MQSLFDSFLGFKNFIPHGFCLSWNPVLLWMHVLSDVLITLSYYSIPLCLAYFVRKRGDDLPYSWLVKMGCVFIVACGTTHLMSAVLIWIPLYWLDGYLKVITAIVSVVTAVAMLRIIPLALKLPSAKQLQTERDDNKEALNRLNEIAKNVPGMVYQFRLNPDGTSCLPYSSPVIQDIYHLTPDDVKESAEKIFDCTHPDDYENLMFSITKSAKNLTPWQHPYRVRFDDGVERWLFGNALPERQADGSILWHGFITDFTEHKMLQVALSNESNKNAAFLHNASDGICIMDKDGKLVECSDSFCNMLGYSRGEMKGMHVSQWDAAIPTDELTTLVNAQFQKPFTRRQFESLHVGKNGSVYDAEISCCAIELDNAEALLFTSTRNISERKRLEQNLIDSKKEIEDLYNNAPCGYHSLDEDGVFTQINDTELNWLGYTREDVIGKMQLTDFFTTEEKLLFQKSFSQLLEKGYVENLDFNLIHKDKNIKHVILTATLTKNAEEKKISHFVLHDITERIKTRKHNEELRNQLVHIQKLDSIGRLTAGIAHDFNNILACILGYAEINHMLNEDLEDQKLKALLEKNLTQIETATKRGAELVDKMLIYCRQNTIKKVISVSPTWEVIENATKMLQVGLTNAFQIELNLDHSVNVEIDGTDLNQVLMNLLVNARDAMQSEGKGIIKIELSKVTKIHSMCDACLSPIQGDFIQLSISDTGSGMQRSELEHIFDPFFTTKEVGAGTGLGLSVVSGILHNVKAHVIVDSEVNKGTTFKLLFPAN